MNINKRLIINTIVGVLIVTILGGVYFWTAKWQPRKTENTVSQGKVYPLINVDNDDVAAIVIKNGEDIFTVQNQGDNQAMPWKVLEYPQYEFSRAKIETLVAIISNLYSNNEIANRDNRPFSEFGLDSETKSITVQCKDRTEICIIIGDSLAVDSSCYAMNKDQQKIYTLPQYTVSELLKGINEYRETLIGDIDKQSITKLAISQNGQKIMEVVQDTKKLDSTFKTSKMRMVYPYNENVNSDNFDEFISAFGDITAIEFVDDKITNVEEYGFDNGITVLIKDDNGVHNIKMGKADERGNIYTRYNKSFVFTMEPSLKEVVADLNPFDYVDKLVHIYSIGEVSSVEVVYQNQKYVLNIKRDDIDAEKAEYSVNGKLINEGEFKKLYQEVIGLTITEPVKSFSKGKKIAEVTFTTTDGREETTQYYEYDERSFIVVKPDGRKYLILKKYVETMVRKINV